MILEMIYDVNYTVILIHQIRISNLKVCVCLTALDKHAPLRNKVVRANNMPYMTKALRKAIATSSKSVTREVKRLTGNKKTFAADYTKR